MASGEPLVWDDHSWLHRACGPYPLVVCRHRYARYSSVERAVHRDAFYQKYLAPDVVWDTEEEDDPEVEAALGVAHRRRKAHTPRPCRRFTRLGLAADPCGAVRQSDCRAFA